MKSRNANPLAESDNNTLDSVIPFELRELVLKLENNPLWLAIGEYLSQVSVRERVDPLILIEEISKRTGEDYYKISEAVKQFKSEGYLNIKAKSNPACSLSPLVPEAMRIRKRFEDQVVIPFFTKLENDPEFCKSEDSEKTIRRIIYSALR